MNSSIFKFENYRMISIIYQMVKIISWNVNGLRTRILDQKDSSQFKGKSCIDQDSSLGNLLQEYDADIICFSETRCSIETAQKFQIEGFHTYWSSSQGIKGRVGDRYSGVAIWSKIPAEAVYDTLPSLEKPDLEGRILTLYYKDFVLVHTYQPNSGTNFEYRTQKWDPAMIDYLEMLGKECDCPVIFTGDLNVAHKPIDLHIGDPQYHFRNHKNRNDQEWIVKQTTKYHQTAKMLGTAKNTSAGFTKLERDNFTELLSTGYIDIYRHLNPDKQYSGYTWWDMRIKPYRKMNRGWRIDYFLINKKYIDIITDFQVFKHIGEIEPKIASDHAPIGITLNLP